MTTHQYPAVLLPQEVEDIERAVAAYRHTLVQAYIHAREWQRQAEQMSASLNAERAAHEATRREAGLLYKTLQEIRRDVHFAHRTVDHSGKWEDLCTSLLRQINNVTPNHTTGAKEAQQLWDETRCRVCGWPLAESADKGCVPGNCSQRPAPATRADAAERRLADAARGGGE